jgi:NADPH2:quinone reductase
VGAVRAVTIHDGGRLVLAERPDPEPGDGELLVAVRAAGLNAADLLQRAGHYPPPPGVPADVPGLELAGEVLAVGRAVRRFRPGDRVMALVGGGAQAELALVDERAALALPEGVDWPVAGGLSEALCTAHDALFSRCRLAMGERALVTGAAGGVGCVAVQLAALAGAEVVASARNPDTHETLRSLGAALAAAPEEALAAGPFDVVLELVGAPSLAGALGALAVGGRAIVIGLGAGQHLDLDLRVLLAKRAQLAGATLRARSPEEKGAVVAAAGRAALGHLRAGRLQVPVLATYPLAEAEAAYERFAAGGKLGKIVLLGPGAG